MSQIKDTKIKSKTIFSKNDDKFYNFDKNNTYLKLFNEIKELEILISKKRLSLTESDKIFDSINIFNILKEQNKLNIYSIANSSILYFRYFFYY
jgi:glycyl-tRNA synthetase alpha subunit